MELSIQELIASIGTSVSEAQQNLEQHSLYRFFDYFDDTSVKYQNQAVDASGEILGNNDSDNVAENGLYPKTAKVAMPNQNDLSKTSIVDVPLLSLVHHRQVTLDKVTVKMKVRLFSDTDNKVKADMNAPIFQGSTPMDSNFEEQSNCGSGDFNEIELVYNVSDRSEGLSRVVQNITKQL